MNTAIRIVVAIPGLLMLGSGIQWLVSPKAAAEGLGMPLLAGVGRSTQIGDIGAFFFATAAMILLGAAQKNAQWLHGAAMLLGGAALMRTASTVFHGAEFVPQLIGAEAVMTVVLLVGAAKISPSTASD